MGIIIIFYEYRLSGANTVSVFVVTGQNGSGLNGTDKVVWTKWYTDKMVLEKMALTKWHGQNGIILYFV